MWIKIIEELLGLQNIAQSPRPKLYFFQAYFECKHQKKSLKKKTFIQDHLRQLVKN